MKKLNTALTILFFVLCSVSEAQVSNSITIWRNDADSMVLLLRNLDSLTFYRKDSSLSVWEKGAVAVNMKESSVDSITILNPGIENTNSKSLEELKAYMDGVTVSTKSYKPLGQGNPLMSQRFGADPYAMEYNGRIYVYMTDDCYDYDGSGNIKKNEYGQIHTINCISSDDMVNWTDHGAMPIAGSTGAAKWASCSWAPSACHKKIDGKERFFLYFANSGGGIGVVTSSTPYGPWTDPIGGPLVSKNMPNCNVEWLFDPAVLVDDDGTGYLYCGGGIANNQYEHPMSARVLKLKDDMIHIDGTAVTIDPPYLFEDAGINKIGNKYVYSYCTNFNAPSNPGSGRIAYMTSDSPMGPFTYQGVFFNNPGDFFPNSGGNNHHALFKFQGKYYLFYHALVLQNAMKMNNLGYRSTNVDNVSVNETTAIIQPVTGTLRGVSKLKNFDPYRRVQAETMATQNGITIERDNNTTNHFVHARESGSWIALTGVDFKNGAEGFRARISGSTKMGTIKICTDPGNYGLVLGYVQIPRNGIMREVTIPLINQPRGVKNLYFVFSGEARMDYWEFF